MSTGRVIAPFTNGAVGTAQVPGSKSITNRAVLCAALASGTSTLHGVLFADDTEAMIEAVRTIGATVHADRAEHQLVIHGIAAPAPTPAPSADEAKLVHARSSGTTARFVLPVLAALGGRWMLDGDPQLRARPFDELIAAQRSLGAQVHELGEPGCLPLEMGSTAPGDQDAATQHIRIKADVSSQFASGLLLAGPLRNGIHVELDPAAVAVSRPYIDMTVAVMEAFGADVVTDGEHGFVVHEGGYRAGDYRIEPDASAATYFWAAGALCGGPVRVEGLGKHSIQGDVRFAEMLGDMGAEVAASDDAIEVAAPPDGRLRGGSFDLRDCSDATQTLAAVAAFADGTTRIDGIGFIRRKETDRVGNTVAELSKRGVDAVAEPDGITIRSNPFGLRSGVVDCHGDHRMAMSMSLIGARVAGVEIDDPDCVAKTFPGFFDAFEALRPAAAIERAPSTPVIAIDGPAASGKSSVARAVAARLGMDYLDTGAMYRAVAWAALHAGADPHDADATADIARSADIDITNSGSGPDGAAAGLHIASLSAAESGEQQADAEGVDAPGVRRPPSEAQQGGVQRVMVNGIDATAAIRSAEVDGSVSAVAANPAVRRILVERQRSWAADLGGGVMEGRDIGSVVFPDAVLKVFLTATPLVRAARRLAQHGTDSSRSAEPHPSDAVHALAEELDRRDRLDASRADSPLQVAPGAVIVDTSELTQDEAVAQVTELYALASAGTSAASAGTAFLRSDSGAGGVPSDAAQPGSHAGTGGPQ